MDPLALWIGVVALAISLYAAVHAENGPLEPGTHTEAPVRASTVGTQPRLCPKRNSNSSSHRRQGQRLVAAL